MKNDHGFTLIEVLMVVIILGIIGALTLINYQKTVARNEIEKEANNLYLELRSLRSQAFKWDSNVITKFTSTGCTIWVDTNGTGVDESDIRYVFTLPSHVTIGNPPELESGDFLFDYEPANGVANTWKDELLVEPDSRGEYSHGTVYLNTAKLPKTTYCIGIKNEMQSLVLCKWDGTVWDTL